MENHKEHSPSDPTEVLRAAVEKLHTLTQHNFAQSGGISNIHNLELREGKLIAVPATSFEKAFDLTCRFIGQLFSRQLRQIQLQQKDQIHKEISEALDVIKSHYELIHQLQKGDPSQQKLAAYALEVIQRYNSMLDLQSESSWVSRFTKYIYKRSDLLLDEGIKGRKIEPRRSAIAQNTLKELGASLATNNSKKGAVLTHSTHKKSFQVMLDVFRMKSVRALQAQLPEEVSMQEVLNLIQSTSIDIEDNPDSALIWMNQSLEFAPGSVVRLIGSFKRHSTGKLMGIPILDSFRLISYDHQPGFPYASQHTGWSLAEALIDAYPLRGEQTPLFNEVERQQEKFAQLLLSDPVLKAHAKQLFQLKKELFDSEKSYFIDLHCRLASAILGASVDPVQENSSDILDRFYASILEERLPFERLSQIHQYIAHCFITQPAQKLKEEWLSRGNPQLRTGTQSERLKAAIRIMQYEVEQVHADLRKEEVVPAYIDLMGGVLGKASRTIFLQYMSEKIGFAPPMLNDFEQKVQSCGFHQSVRFFDELDAVLDESHEMNQKFMREWLERLISEDIEIFSPQHFDDLEDSFTDRVNELEVYFNSRYYALPRPPTKPEASS